MNLKHFDFDRVQAAMLALNWTWQDAPEPPSVKELKETAGKMVGGVLLDRNCLGSEAGGFLVERGKDEDGEYVSLSFVVSSVRIYESDFGKPGCDP